MSGSVTIRRLEHPSEQEINRIDVVLQESFKNEPYVKLLMGGDMSLVPIRFNANVRAAATRGEIHVAALGPQPSDIIGAGLWYGPGKAQFFTDEERAADNFFLIISDKLKAWWDNEYLPATKKFAEDSVGAGFYLNNWSLHMFGVVPEHHRKGIGKTMISFAENLAKKDGVSICLDTMTESSMNIYKHMGFEVKGETKIGSWVGEAPLYVMTKTP